MHFKKKKLIHWNEMQRNSNMGNLLKRIPERVLTAEASISHRSLLFSYIISFTISVFSPFYFPAQFPHHPTCHLSLPTFLTVLSFSLYMKSITILSHMPALPSPTILPLWALLSHHPIPPPPSLITSTTLTSDIFVVYTLWMVIFLAHCSDTVH